MPVQPAALSLRQRASLAFMALMMTVPFLQSVHLSPIASFHAEWWAAAFGLAAAAPVFLSKAAWQACPVPRVAMLAALFIAAITVQAVAGLVRFPEIALLHCLYLLWAALLCCLGALLKRDLGLPALAGTLAWALLLGGLCSALLAVAQFLDHPAPLWLVFPDNVPSTNLGQRNHAADYLWLAMASAIYLHVRNAISLPTAILALSLLVVGSVLTGSRSPIVYGIALGALAAGWHRQGGARAATALGLAGLAFCGQIVGSILVSIAPLPPESGLGTMRMSPAALASDGRWIVWRTAWSMFLDAPWLGNGVGNYHWRSFETVTEPSWLQPLVAEHAHNIFLQWLADYGLPVTLAATLVLAAWLRDAVLRNRLDVDRWWLLALLAILAIHSSLEYPLWYAFFLGPAALLLGASAGHNLSLTFPQGRNMFALALAFAVITLVNLWGDYRRLGNTAYGTGGAGDRDSAAWQEAAADLAAVARSSLLSPVANLGIALAMSPDKARAADQMIVCSRAMSYQPQPPVVAKCAILEEWRGNPQRAAELIRRIKQAYPGEQEMIGRSIVRWRQP